ncbi:hypothetical protein SAMN02800692_2282 [Luteibacter sp. UNC138MFCol5.1]|nr:hypothetical protein SAMN02800692_2282 [Luteibacter sp. UNC138MFCol5.1]
MAWRIRPELSLRWKARRGVSRRDVFTADRSVKSTNVVEIV